MSGFGINTNILETNLINLGVIIGALIYLGGGFIGPLLDGRKERIFKDLREANERYERAQQALREAQSEFEQAQTNAVAIRTEAKTTAENLAAQMMTRCEQDVARFTSSTQVVINAEQEKIKRKIRSQFSQEVLRDAKSRLKNLLYVKPGVNLSESFSQHSNVVLSRHQTIIDGLIAKLDA